MRAIPWRRTAALSLALLLLAGCDRRVKLTEQLPGASALPVMAPASAEPTATPEPTAPPAEETAWEDIARPDGVHADVQYAGLRWYLYDMTEFDRRAEALAAAADPEELQEHHDWLRVEYARLQTLDTLAWNDFYAAGGRDDAALSEACRLTDEMLRRAEDTLRSGISDALEGDAGEDFARELGDAAALLADYEEMSDRELELWDIETELKLRYNELAAANAVEDTALRRELGELFLELVAVRNELADIYGYDSFAEMAYDIYYARDYTPDQVQKLSQAVKPYAKRYFENCYYCGAFFDDLGDAVCREPEELIALLCQYAPEISPRAAEAQAYMEEHGLYLLDSAENIAELGYTTVLDLFNAPFLYNALYGGMEDIQSTIHEFGHYYDAYVNPNPDPLTMVGSYDIFEIHSTSMEALSYGWYDEIFGSAAEAARIHCLDSLMYNVVSGCMMDEFQQYAYAHPEVGVDGLNRAYRRIAVSYGMGLFTDADGVGWMGVSHNFESPFYYISYAASALASLQVWDLSQEDRTAALALYNDIVERGAYEPGYCELLTDVGLAPFTEGLDACLAAPYAVLEEMCLRYDGLLESAA